MEYIEVFIRTFYTDEASGKLVNYIKKIDMPLSVYLHVALTFNTMEENNAINDLKTIHKVEISNFLPTDWEISIEENEDIDKLFLLILMRTTVSQNQTILANVINELLNADLIKIKNKKTSCVRKMQNK